MKKLICVIAFICLIPSYAMASPRLVCDPQNGVEYYELEINGAVIGQSFLPEPNGGSYGVSIDLAPLNIKDGETIYRLRAGNKWGVSKWSVPLQESKHILGAPSSVAIIQ